MDLMPGTGNEDNNIGSAAKIKTKAKLPHPGRFPPGKSSATPGDKATKKNGKTPFSGQSTRNDSSFLEECGVFARRDANKQKTKDKTKALSMRAERNCGN